MKFLMSIPTQFIWQKATFPLPFSPLFHAAPCANKMLNILVIICTISNRNFVYFLNAVQHGTVIIWNRENCKQF